MISTLAHFYSLAAPILLLALLGCLVWNRFVGRRRGTATNFEVGIRKNGTIPFRRMIAALLIAAGIVAFPVQGIPLGRWAFGLTGNLSVVFTCLLAVGLARASGLHGGFGRRDFAAAWIFGVVAGLLLYPMSLGLGCFDPYALGWNSWELPVLTAIFTLGLFLLGNRFAWLLLAAMTARGLGLLESTNYWDYLVDPVYFFASAIGITVQAIVPWGLSRFSRRENLQDG